MSDFELLKTLQNELVETLEKRINRLKTALVRSFLLLKRKSVLVLTYRERCAIIGNKRGGESK